MNNKLPYSTPEGYFNNLKERIPEKAFSERTGVKPFDRIAPLAAIAASMLILLGIGGFILNRSSSPTHSSEPSEDEIIEYLIDSRAPLAYFYEPQ